MWYARVVIGLPVEGPFDYIVPDELNKKIKVGLRVKIDFHNQKKIGYVVGLSTKTRIKNLKSVISILDDVPILDENMLFLTKEISEYYCCSWGEAIETTLPESLRNGKTVVFELDNIKRKYNKEINKFRNILIHDLDNSRRWEIYIKHIKETLEDDRSVIILLPDVHSALRVQNKIETQLGFSPAILYRQRYQELEEWLKVKCGKVSIAIGTRSAVFAPFKNLGLIIVDEEQSQHYKQDQMPHYNARDIALMRASIDNAKVIFGSSCPSLETFYLAKQRKIDYLSFFKKIRFPHIRIIDTKNLIGFQKKTSIVISKYLEDSIAEVLNSKGKVLLFINRRGFATFAFCRNCQIILKCPRCSINLVYHFKQNVLDCHYCNFNMQPPQLCPYCNSGYIRYTGIGTEKIESELARLFPQARILRVEKDASLDINSVDIVVATKSIIGHSGYSFDLVGILSIDNSLNRLDFRAAEKSFDLLIGLLKLSDKKIVIQTNMPQHYCFQALLVGDIDKFYTEELKQREQLNFPPYQHICLVKLRGKNETKLSQISQVIFKKLKKGNRNKKIEIVSCNPMNPYRLRGNFYWQILIKTDSPFETARFLKKYLKKSSYSDIIITVDMDPL